ncbi:MAG: FAD-binding protein, partial [Planctomycetaceae bacterium]|nr:FAD-binding protein [Planctomycetaceae bacterium]
MYEYVNAWKNVRFQCAGIDRPASTEAVVELVNRARRERLKLKPFGGRHSFNNIVKTGGRLVDLSGMNQVLDADPVRGTVSLQGGIVLADAIEQLDARGIHFPSLGSYSNQTIAGVIATSTHGSTLHHGTSSDLVLGLEAVLSDGSVIKLVGDDPRLKAFRTSLGQLGIVARVDLACTPAFYLSCAIRTVPEDEGFATIVETARTHEYASMLWLPYVAETSVRILSRFEAIGRNEIAARREQAALRRNRLTNTIVDIGEYLAGQAFLRVPRLLRRWYSGLIHRAFFDDDGVVDKSYNVFLYDEYREPNTNHYLRMIFNSEYALDVAELEATLRQIREVLHSFAARMRYINYPRIHVRFSQRSDRTLIGLNSGRDTAHVGIYIVASVRHKPQIPVARAIEQVMIDHGGRPHWGKFRYARSDEYKQTYPQLAEFLALRAELDPIGMFSDGAAPFDDLDLLERPPVGRMIA